VLSGRGLCDKLITCPKESHRLCCVVVCDLETSRMRRPWPALGRTATGKKWDCSTPSAITLDDIQLSRTNSKVTHTNCSISHHVSKYKLL
jgi:hypothetical protein